MKVIIWNFWRLLVQQSYLPATITISTLAFEKDGEPYTEKWRRVLVFRRFALYWRVS